MPTEPLILGFDTSAAHCAAALLRADKVLATRHEDMKRGQAERLMPLLQDVLQDAGHSWRDLDAIAVGIGPGNFTGIRIAVSAARGLALARKIPAVGVSSFEVMAEHATISGEEGALICIPAPRDQVYLQLFDAHGPRAKPVQIDPAAPDGALGVLGATQVVGAMADPIAQALGITQAKTVDISRIALHIAQIAARKLATGQTIARAAPLYIRPADAAPPSDPPPKVLD
ncbi:tRNA (adenosine(37)-N6)-threonylcarbamoyltransferase complex dimerization subunit type 1 TsaB [Rhodobacteraceae bacterium]|nr:tRNA (adenosine(37)-N6)-threonylcarbamoyltransferase complex dimerization subunit type 1 TsaB [Paracoccaceae bacterium]